MEKFKVSFEANNQQLKAIGTKHASDTYADIEAEFVLGNRWTDMDSVSAVWWNDFTRVATVLDSQGKCIVPHEVLTRKGCVRVNLVGSIVEGDELVTRLTSYSAEAVQVNEKIKLTGNEPQSITPSQYEQFVQNVKADADRAETVRDEAEAARDVAVSAKDTAVNAVEGFEDIVDTATATAVQTIQGEGATQVTAIQTEGTTQVASVRTEGSTQVTAVQDKGDEVLDSIPADYTQLSQNVTDLKSDLTSLENTTTEDSTVNLFDAVNGYANTMRYYENGNEYSNANYYTSPFTEVEQNSFYTITSIAAHICLWDSNHNFIKGNLIPAGTTGSITVNTKSATYLTISVPNNAKNISSIYKIVPVFKDIVEKAKNNGEVLDSLMSVERSLFNKENATDGYIYYYENGTQSSNASYCTSEFIECDAESWYGAGTANAHICLWDSEKHFIKGYLVLGTIPDYKFYSDNASYITISLPINVKDTTVLGKLTLVHRKYMPYQPNYIYRQFTIPATKEVGGTTATNTACLKLPTTYEASGAPTKLCIICHGASGGISASSGWTLSADYNNIVNALLNAGFAVMDSNGYSDSGLGYNHWGCPQALAGYYMAWDYFTKIYNLDREVYVYGFSMGGLTALSLLFQGTIPIKCAMVASPVISLYQHCVVQNGGVTRDDFKSAYDGNDYSEEVVRGYDRYLDILTIDNQPRVLNTLKPLFIAYGVNDVSVSNPKILEYYEALKNCNTNVVLKAYEGGHEISYGQSSAVITDIIRWFKRY